MRRVFGETLLRLGGERGEIVVLTGDVAEPTHTHGFAERYPDRFFNVGICEQDMIDIAAGLALGDRIPIVAVFASFLMRAWEQIRSTVARSNLPVKMVGTHAGLSSAEEGCSHQSLEDVAVMRVLPNVAVVVPGDRQEIAEATEAMIGAGGPVYLRLGRDCAPKFLEGEGVFRLGKAVTLADGHDMTVFSNGIMTAEVLSAVGRSKVSAKVVHVPTVKPLDRAAVVAAARETGTVVCVEEHSVIGGLGGAVAEVLSEEYPLHITRIGVQDTFCESGPYASLLEKHGLTSERIGAALKEVLAKARARETMVMETETEKRNKADTKANVDGKRKEKEKEKEKGSR